MKKVILLFQDIQIEYFRLSLLIINLIYLFLEVGIVHYFYGILDNLKVLNHYLVLVYLEVLWILKKILY